MTRMLGSDAILRSLEAEGVDVMFGIPGGAILPTYDAIARGTTVRHVLARHEQGAGHMAEGFARASGRVGVAMATSGPGATNLVTPIADAWMDSTPLVCITGQVRSNLIGTDAFQETDATGITMPIVKHSWLVLDARDIPQAIRSAFHVARTGRPGPVLVDIAKDAQEGEVDFSYPSEPDLPGWRPPTRVHERQVREAAAAIAEASQPIVYAGGGVLNADASAELLALVEAARLPSVVTLMGKGCLPDSHPLNYGAPGMHGSKYANWALNKSDLIVAVGVRFDDRVTGKVSAFAPGAKVIHFDIDAAEVGKIREADIPVVGPLKLALAQLTRDVKAIEAERRVDRTAWHAQLEEWRALYPYKYRKAEGVLKPQTVIERLRDLSGERDGDFVWTTGVGQHQMWAMQYLQCEKPRTFITSGGLGTMGYGLPAAVGAKAARPDATVVCVDGDGCFQMTCQELATAALERLPIVVVIINNGWLGMVRQWQELFYAERYAETHLTKQVPDYAQLAEALGAAGFMVDNEDDLDATLASALDCGRTAVVDARVDPDENCYPMVPAGAASVDIIELPDESAEEPERSML
jgi:acetolactate synthase I/II/III large subunit